MNCREGFIFLIIAIILSACSRPGYYEIGHNAYLRQDYHVAFVNLHEAATLRDWRAEYPVGFMYFYGLGTPKSLVDALFWLRKSAEHGDKNALEAINNLDNNMMRSLIMGGGKKHGR